MNANGPTTSFLRDDGAPDWDAITFDVCCSRCGYNLRTLTRPLCPECGLTFEWPEVLDRSAFRSDFLLEHNWRRRPFSSFAKTIWRSFLPTRFWTKVSIHEEVRIRPLLLMPVLATLVFPVVLHGSAFLAAGVYEIIDGPIVPSWKNYGCVGAPVESPVTDAFYELQQFAQLPSNAPPGYVLVFPGTFVFLAVATMVLCGLRQTLGKCKVRSGQVIRVVAYSSIPITVWAALFLVFAMFVIEALAQSMSQPFEIASGLLTLGSLFVIPSLYFRVGLGTYLRLPRATALALAASLIALLTVVTAIVLRELAMAG